MRISIAIIKIFTISHFIGLNGCMSEIDENADMASDYGFNIYFDGNSSYTKAEIDYTIGTVIETTESLASDDFPQGSILSSIEPYSENMTIYIVEEKQGPKGSCATANDPDRACKGFQCENGNSKWCEGLYDPNKIEIKVSHKKCIGKSALAHELIHLFAHLTNKDGNSNHSNKKYFSSHNSIEVQAKKTISDDLCD